MAGFDIIVLTIVGVAAIGGFLRGLVQEVLSLAAWVLAGCAVFYLHSPLTEILRGYINSETGTPLLAFVLLLLIPYAAMKLIAKNIGEASRNSILGPIDRILGFGFGAVKGGLITVFAFSVLALGYDTGWGYKGRPDWITSSKTYLIVDAGSRGLVAVIEERRARLKSEDDETQ